MLTYSCFADIYTSLQKSDDGSNNRLFGYFHNLSRKYSVDQTEVNRIGLDSILKVSDNIDKVKNKTALESYIWATIRHGVINYAKGTKSIKMITEAEELDDQYGFTDPNFELIDAKYDMEKAIGLLTGKAWYVANLLYLLGSNTQKNSILISKIVGITTGQYRVIMKKLRIHFLNLGYCYST